MSRERVQERLAALGGPPFPPFGGPSEEVDLSSERARLGALWLLYRFLDGDDPGPVPVPLEVVNCWHNIWDDPDPAWCATFAPWTARRRGRGVIMDGVGSPNWHANDLREALDEAAAALLDAPRPVPAPDPGYRWAPCDCAEIDPSDRPCPSCAAQGRTAPPAAPSQEVLRRALERVLGRSLPADLTLRCRRLTVGCHDSLSIIGDEGYAVCNGVATLGYRRWPFDITPGTETDGSNYRLYAVGVAHVRRTAWESALAAAQGEPAPASAEPTSAPRYIPLITFPVPAPANLWTGHPEQARALLSYLTGVDLARATVEVVGHAPDLSTFARNERLTFGLTAPATVAAALRPLAEGRLPHGGRLVQFTTDRAPQIRVGAEGLAGLTYPDEVPITLALTIATEELTAAMSATPAPRETGPAAERWQPMPASPPPFLALAAAAVPDSPAPSRHAHAGVAATQAEQAARAAAPMPAAKEPAGRMALLELDPETPEQAEARRAYLAAEAQRIAARKQLPPRRAAPALEPADPPERFALLEPRAAEEVPPEPPPAPRRHREEPHDPHHLPRPARPDGHGRRLDLHGTLPGEPERHDRQLPGGAPAADRGPGDAGGHRVGGAAAGEDRVHVAGVPRLPDHGVDGAARGAGAAGGGGAAAERDDPVAPTIPVLSLEHYMALVGAEPAPGRN